MDQLYTRQLRRLICFAERHGACTLRICMHMRLREKRRGGGGVPIKVSFILCRSNSFAYSPSPTQIHIVRACVHAFMHGSLVLLQCPENTDNTAICLVCGCILDASGNGSCTKHATLCGAGTGIFFLLHECIGLILHKNKACYLKSVYVDSHGETPVFRGKPLQVDEERYDVYRNLWNSHGVRGKVMGERRMATRTIILDHY